MLVVPGEPDGSGRCVQRVYICKYSSRSRELLAKSSGGPALVGELSLPPALFEVDARLSACGARVRRRR